MRLPDFVEVFDHRVDVAFGPLRGREPTDRIAYLASELADFSIGWHLANVVIALLRPDRELHALRMAATLGVESLLVNGLVKPMFKRDRPDDWEELASVQVRRPKTASFPSGHASSAVVAAVMLSDAMPSLKPVWYTAAAVVGGSRIYTRMHHASDVLAGAVLGAAIGVTAKRLMPLD